MAGALAPSVVAYRSSGGFGTPAHIADELFKLQAGMRATHVPYQGLPHAIGDLLNGTNQYQFITPATMSSKASVWPGRTRGPPRAASRDVP